MQPVQAVFEDGVFRPLGNVSLPEHCVVEFEPRVLDETPVVPTLDQVYDLLSARFRSEETDVAARHNEHQP